MSGLGCIVVGIYWNSPSPPPFYCRDFIEKHYVELKQLNPKFPFLIRECSGIEPKLYGRFGKSDQLKLGGPGG